MGYLVKLLSVAALFGLSFGSVSFADDVARHSYGDIPVDWDEYSLSEDVIQAHIGDEKKELCLDDDFISKSKNYLNYRESVRGSRSKVKYKFLIGGEDFVVVDTNSFILTTPLTGSHLIETSGCRKSMRRAKYIRVIDDISRSVPDRCYKRSSNSSQRYVQILTRNRRGLDSCEIEKIYSWNGDVSLETLKEQSQDSKAKAIAN